MKNYFLIHEDQDGDISIEQFDEEKLLKRINDQEDYYGTTGFMEKIEALDIINLDCNKLLLIKGEVIVPKPKEVVKRYEL